MSDTKITFDSTRAPSPAPCGCVLHEATAVLLCPLHAAAPDLLAACEGLGAMPEGYCFCYGHRRDPLKPEHEHTGECREARAAIAKAKGVEQ